MGDSPIAVHPPAPEFSMIESIKSVSAHMKKNSEREDHYISKIELVESSMVPAPRGSSRHWMVVTRKHGEERAKEVILYVSMEGMVTDTPPARKTQNGEQDGGGQPATRPESK